MTHPGIVFASEIGPGFSPDISAHQEISLYVSARVEGRFRFSCREEDLRHADS